MVIFIKQQDFLIANIIFGNFTCIQETGFGRRGRASEQQQKIICWRYQFWKCLINKWIQGCVWKEMMLTDSTSWKAEREVFLNFQGKLFFFLSPSHYSEILRILISWPSCENAVLIAKNHVLVDCGVCVGGTEESDMTEHIVYYISCFCTNRREHGWTKITGNYLREKNLSSKFIWRSTTDKTHLWLKINKQ